MKESDEPHRFDWVFLSKLLFCTDSFFLLSSKINY
jgi:hypothetical protein